jgi:PAS domain-containing protein
MLRSFRTALPAWPANELLPVLNVLATIRSSAKNGLLSFSLDGTIQSGSAGAEQLYGYGAAEITGQPLATLLPIYETTGFCRSPKRETLLAVRVRSARCVKRQAKSRVVSQRASTSPKE